LFGAGEAGAFPNIGICVTLVSHPRAGAGDGDWLMFMQIGGAIAPGYCAHPDALWRRTSFYVMGIAGVV
jgi:hypothetical protein